MGYTPQKDTKFTGTETLSNLTSSAGAINLTGSTTVTTPTITVGSSTQKCANDTAVATYVAGQLASYATITALNNAVAGIDNKASVRAATTAAGTLASSFANASVIDSVTLSTGDRILIKDQAAAAENGIYTVNASGAPTRATDFDTWAEIPGSIVAVEVGPVNSDKAFLSTADQGGTLGSTAITFTTFGAGTTYSGGTYVTLTGTSFDLNTATAMTLGTAQTVTGVKTLNAASSGTVILAAKYSGQTYNNVELEGFGRFRWINSSTGVGFAGLGPDAAVSPTSMVATGSWDLTGATTSLGANATASTPTPGDNDTSVATTAFVQRDSRRKNMVTVVNASFPYIMTSSGMLPNADVVVCQQTAAKDVQLPLANTVSSGTIITIKDGSTTGARNPAAPGSTDAPGRSPLGRRPRWWRHD